MTGTAAPLVRLRSVTHLYGRTVAIDSLDLELWAGRLVGFIGPDGVGKSTLLALISGVRKIQAGGVEVFGGDMTVARIRARLCARIAYMPQGLGKNLYPTLSVYENVDFFGRLFGQSSEERAKRIEELLASTALTQFRDRPAGKLSGGMRQKLSLCCALMPEPELLILDEPTTGVDPLSRRQFWELIERMRKRRPGLSVLVATAYMEEAERFDWLVAIEAGKVLSIGTPGEMRSRGNAESLEEAFIALLPRAASGKARPGNPAARAKRPRSRDRGTRADPPLRRFYGGGSRQLSHRARRDFRVHRVQWLRQDYDDEDADGAPSFD